MTQVVGVGRFESCIDADDDQLRIGCGYDHDFALEEESGGCIVAAAVLESASGRRGGFCLETQHSPVVPNRPEVPSTVLRQGEVHESAGIYRFSRV